METSQGSSIERLRAQLFVTGAKMNSARVHAVLGFGFFERTSQHGRKGHQAASFARLGPELREFFLRVFDHGGLLCVARHVVVLDQAKQLTGLLVRVSRKLGHENFEKRAQKLKGNAYVHNVEPVHLYAVHSYKGRAEKGTHLRRRQQSLPRTLPVSRLQPAGLSLNFIHAGRRHIAHPAAAASFVPAAAAVAKNVKTQT